MSKTEKAKAAPKDLRQGVHGTLVVHEPNLAGAPPQHQLDQPGLVSPDLIPPEGQANHG